MILKAFEGAVPSVHPRARLSGNVVLTGGAVLEEDVNVWYGAVIRADMAAIRVGAGSNIQDNATLHCDTGFPLLLGRDVTVGHGAILHGCTIGDRCLIGMGAILLNGCVIGEDSLVAAGALVTQNTVIPPGSLVMGSPAKVRRALTDEERASLRASAAEYRKLALQLPAAEEAEKP